MRSLPWEVGMNIQKRIEKLDALIYALQKVGAGKHPTVTRLMEERDALSTTIRGDAHGHK
jgi:hypothetical protein